jgi:hypothetical protein
MTKFGHIGIRISGSKGNLELSPDNYDIRDIISVLENAENLLFPGEKRDRPVISYHIENGSVKHVFKTSLQFVIGFNAVLGQISSDQSIDILHQNTAKAIESFQDVAAKKNYVFNIYTSIGQSNTLKIDSTTRFYRTESIWADAEFYFYGKVVNAGGKNNANIHLNTDEYGVIRIQTPISFLEQYEDNLLYKSLGIRASGKQNTDTGEIDTSSLNFIELVHYESKYNEDYLKSLRDKATKSWLGKVNSDLWLDEIRGGYDV